MGRGIGDDDTVAWLRNELRRSEERMSRVVVQLDTFKRDVARALHVDVHEKVDEALLLAKIRSVKPGVCLCVSVCVNWILSFLINQCHHLHLHLFQTHLHTHACI